MNVGAVLLLKMKKKLFNIVIVNVLDVPIGVGKNLINDACRLAAFSFSAKLIKKLEKCGLFNLVCEIEDFGEFQILPVVCAGSLLPQFPKTPWVFSSPIDSLP
jgi:hypothetical protein